VLKKPRFKKVFRFLKFLYKDQTRKYDPKAKAHEIHEKHPIHGTPFYAYFSCITAYKTTSITLIYLIIKSNTLLKGSSCIYFEYGVYLLHNKNKKPKNLHWAFEVLRFLNL